MNPTATENDSDRIQWLKRRWSSVEQAERRWSVKTWALFMAMVALGPLNALYAKAVIAFERASRIPK